MLVERHEWSLQSYQWACILYLSRVNGVVHDLDPSLERGDLKEREIGFSHVVKVHWWIEPRVVLSCARVSVRDDFLTNGGLVLVHALKTWFKIVIMWPCNKKYKSITILFYFIKFVYNLFSSFTIIIQYRLSIIESAAKLGSPLYMTAKQKA